MRGVGVGVCGRRSGREGGGRGGSKEGGVVCVVQEIQNTPCLSRVVPTCS